MENILNQIERIILLKIENNDGDLITSLVIDNGSPYGFFYNIWFKKGYLKFKNKSEMIKYLTYKGWKFE